MGIRFKKRGRYEKLNVNDIHVAYAISQKNEHLENLNDIEPIITDALSKAEAQRKKQLDTL